MEKYNGVPEQVLQIRKHAKHGAKYINDAMGIEEKGGKNFFIITLKVNNFIMFVYLYCIYIFYI